MNEEEVRFQLVRVLGDYLVTGNTVKAKRRLNVLMLNAGKNQGLKNRKDILEKIEITKKWFR